MWIAGDRRGLGASLAECMPLAFLLLCAVADGWRMWPLLMIWIGGYAVRQRHGDRQLTTDCAVLGVLYTWLAGEKLIATALKSWKEWRGWIRKAEGSLVTYAVFSVALPLALLAFFSWRMFASSKNTAATSPDISPWRTEVETPKPKIFPCQTTHARIFPKRHAFAYSYLQCGFPIVSSGMKHSGIELPSGDDQTLGRWWLRVRAEDYLERGCGAFGFYWKLRTYLRAQHVEDSEWEYAYLVTAPRFFGYAFNPVSFWYIYDREHQLKKMILEVNNTFGERRMYLLDGSSPPSPPCTSDSEHTSGPEGQESQVPKGSKTKFTDVWMKDFHVSPFNSRKGSYALKAQNPFPSVDCENAAIDNTITLKSSKDHGKLVARLYSTGKAIDPDHLGFFGTARFILSWWWVGLVTFPRIIREAFKIFFKRKLHVWFRPEVLASSVGRLPTSAEM
jgi:DUF1365 family protein